MARYCGENASKVRPLQSLEMAVLVQFLGLGLFAFFYTAALKAATFHFRIAWFRGEELVLVPGKIAHGIFLR